MKYSILILFFSFFLTCGTPFTGLIRDRNVAVVFFLICNEVDPVEEDLDHSDYSLCSLGRRLLPEEKLALQQFVEALDADISSYQLSFSMAQVRARGPHIGDLTINCMLRYYQEIRDAQFDSLIGRPLGTGGSCLIFPEIINEVIRLYEQVNP